MKHNKKYDISAEPRYRNLAHLPNGEILQAMFDHGLNLRSLAFKASLAPSTLCARMKTKMSKAETERILKIINQEGDQK